MNLKPLIFALGISIGYSAAGVSGYYIGTRKEQKDQLQHVRKAFGIVDRCMNLVREQDGIIDDQNKLIGRQRRLIYENLDKICEPEQDTASIPQTYRL